MKPTKKTSKLLAVTCLLFLYSATYLTGQTYTWENKRNFPIYFELPESSNEHEITLTVTTSSTPDLFLLTYPDPEEGFEVLKPGYAFNTQADISLGEHVAFGQVTGNYILRISKNPSGSGMFTDRRIWGLVVINSSDIANITASVSTPGTLLENGAYWYNETSVPFVFTIPADIGVPSEETDDITRVTMTVVTEINDPTFNLTFPDAAVAGTDQERYLYSQITAGIDINYPSNTSGYHVVLDESSPGIFVLQISRNHSMGEFINTFGLGSPPSQTDEVFSLTITKPASIPVNSPVDPITTVSISSETPDGGPGVIIPADPVQLNYSPFVAIDVPGNLPYLNPYPVMQHRVYGYGSEIHDESTDVITLTKNWHLDGGASFSSDVDPAFTDSFAGVGTHDIEVTVSEEVARPGLSAIPQSSSDRLQLEIIQTETALFPPYRGVPGDTDAPDIDGTVSTDFNDYNNRLGDRGWNEAFRVTYQGGTHPDMAFQGVSGRNSSEPFIYCSFEVANDATFDQFDTIIMALSADQDATTSTDNRMILIHPFPDAAVPIGEDITPDDIRIWSPADGWIVETHPNYPSNIVAKLKNTNLPLSDSWNLEIQIPTSTGATGGGTNWIDINDDFLFYFNVFRVDNTDPSNKNVAEFHFPKKAPDVIGDIETYPYSPVWWADAKKGTSDVTLYNGLYISRSDVTVTADPAVTPIYPGRENATIGLPNGSSGTPGTIPVVRNTFEAIIHNNTFIDDGTPSPDYQSVGDIEVGFSVAAWGIPSNRQPDEWQAIPQLPPDSGSNPITGLTVPAQDEPGHPYPVTMQWTLDWDDPADATDISYYSTSPHEHQCVLVELNATSNVNILTRSVYRNMDFVTASEFARKAVISARGYGLPGTGKETHTFFLNVTKKEWTNRYDPKSVKRNEVPFAETDLGGSSSESDNGAENSYLYYTVHGYLATGNSVVIKGENCEVVDPVGSFGYIVEHEGEVTGWEDDIDGAEKVDDNTYVLEILPDAVAEVTTRIKPIEPPPLSVSLHAGAAMPLPPSNFASDYRTGFCLIGDIAYAVRDRFSITGLVGYNYFPAKSSGIDDASVLNIALNGKYYVPVGNNMAVGIGAGPELFIHDFSTVDFGYDLDVSYDWRLNRRLALELGAIYHSHFSQEVWFVQAHGGVIVSF